MNLAEYPYIDDLYTKGQNIAAARVMDIVIKSSKITPQFKAEMESAVSNINRNGLEFLAPINPSFMTETEEAYLRGVLDAIVDEINEKVLVNDPTKVAVSKIQDGQYVTEMTLDEMYDEMKHPYQEKVVESVTRAERGNPDFAVGRMMELGRNLVGRGYIQEYEVKRLTELINEHMLYEWAPEFNKVEITLCQAPSTTISYGLAPLTEETAIRLMDGSMTVRDIVYSEPTIRMKISESVFSNIDTPRGLHDFMERAVEVYTDEIPAVGDELSRALVTSPMEYKLAFSDSRMLGHLESVLLQLFSYQGFDPVVPDDLGVLSEDVFALTSMYTGVPLAPDFEELKKQKTKVVEAMKEDAKYMLVTPSHLREIIESLDHVYSEESAMLAKEKMNRWLSINSAAPQEYTEGWGQKRKKRLKKIPLSTVAYVQVEGENIRDANDKYMIAAYCLGKIELVEWYIELLQSGSEKYEVPHNLQYLERMRTDLLAAYKTIMSRPIPSPNKPIIDIKYPEENGRW